MPRMTSSAASASSQCAICAASKPRSRQRHLEVVGRAVGRVEVEGEELQPPPLDRLRVLRPHRARGAAARVDQRLVRVRGVVLGEGRAQHHALAADLDAPGEVDLHRQVVDQRAGQDRDVLAGRPVPARDRPREPPVLVDQRQARTRRAWASRPPAGRGSDPRTRRPARAWSPSRARASAASGAPARAARVGAPTCLQRVRVGRELRMLDQQRPELLLERVVLGVGDLRVAVVVRRAQLGDLPGEVLDAFLHPRNARRAYRTFTVFVVLRPFWVIVSVSFVPLSFFRRFFAAAVSLQLDRDLARGGGVRGARADLHRLALAAPSPSRARSR